MQSSEESSSESKDESDSEEKEPKIFMLHYGRYEVLETEPYSPEMLMTYLRLKLSAKIATLPSSSDVIVTGETTVPTRNTNLYKS